MTKVPIVIADVGDDASLQKMAARARVIVNCVGPYRFHGEAVVKSCLAGGAHHVDISGEPQVNEILILSLRYLYCVFTYIYSLLIEKDICDCPNVPVFLLCVYMCL